MNTGRNDQPKVILPPETNVWRRQGRLAQQRTYFGQNSDPNQRISDLTDGTCSGRHAEHDPGFENTQIGPTRPYLPRCVFMLDRFFLPLTHFNLID